MSNHFCEWVVEDPNQKVLSTGKRISGEEETTGAKLLNLPTGQNRALGIKVRGKGKLKWREKMQKCLRP